MATTDQTRIVSLDQFRGYTVLGMFFVNFIGGYAAIHPVFMHHNTYCSYADTIMPQFFFAVGFAYRLTFLRKLAADGPRAAYSKAIKRVLGLLLFSACWYGVDGGFKAWKDVGKSGFSEFLNDLSSRDIPLILGDIGRFFNTTFKRNYFQTLVHIAVTSIWIMPVIAARPAVLVAYACLSGLLHLALSFGFYYSPGHYWSAYEYVNRPGATGIDGGPLGFLTWTIPMVAGVLAHDALMAGSSSPAISDKARGAFGKILIWGFILMVLGYGMSCIRIEPGPAKNGDSQTVGWTMPSVDFKLEKPPFMPPESRKYEGTFALFAKKHERPAGPPNILRMSQRAGSISYLTFGAGLSLALCALFMLACDVWGLQIGFLRTLGVNALAGYIIHELVMEHLVKRFTPRDADTPLWYVLSAVGIYLLICYVFLRYLEKNKLYLRL